MGKIKDLVKLSGTRAQVQQLVDGMLIKYLSLYASYKDKLSSVWYRKAREFWRYYVDDAIQRDQARQKPEQLGLPTFEKLHWAMVRELLLGRKPFHPALAYQLRRRLDLPKGWEKQTAQEFFNSQRLRDPEARLRGEAYRKAYSPLPGREGKSFVEQEEEERRRKKEAEKRREDRRRQHRH